MAVAQPIRTPEEAGQDMSGPRKPRPKGYHNTVFAPGHTDMPVQPYRVATGVPVRPMRIPDGDTLGVRSTRFYQGPVKPVPQETVSGKRLAERWHISYNHVPGLPLGLRLAIIILPFIGVAGLAYLLQWLGMLQ